MHVARPEPHQLADRRPVVHSLGEVREQPDVDSFGKRWRWEKPAGLAQGHPGTRQAAVFRRQRGAEAPAGGMLRGGLSWDVVGAGDPSRAELLRPALDQAAHQRHVLVHPDEWAEGDAFVAVASTHQENALPVLGAHRIKELFAVVGRELPLYEIGAATRIRELQRWRQERTDGFGISLEFDS